MLKARMQDRWSSLLRSYAPGSLGGQLDTSRASIVLQQQHSLLVLVPFRLCSLSPSLSPNSQPQAARTLGWLGGVCPGPASQPFFPRQSPRQAGSCRSNMPARWPWLPNQDQAGDVRAVSVHRGHHAILRHPLQHSARGARRDLAWPDCCSVLLLELPSHHWTTLTVGRTAPWKLCLWHPQQRESTSEPR